MSARLTHGAVLVYDNDKESRPSRPMGGTEVVRQDRERERERAWENPSPPTGLYCRFRAEHRVVVDELPPAPPRPQRRRH